MQKISFPSYQLNKKGPATKESALADEISKAFNIPWKSVYFGAIRAAGYQATLETFHETKDVKLFWYQIGKQKKKMWG